RKGSAHFQESTFHIGNHVDATASGSTAYVDLETRLPSDKQISLLKVDIEGSELASLRNYPSILQRSRAIIIELHDELCDIAECRSVITSAGFNEGKVIRKFRNFS